MKQRPRPLPADDDMLRSLAMLELSEGEIAAMTRGERLI
jgi:hypothetical protein